MSSPNNDEDETPGSQSGVSLPIPAGAAFASSSNWTLTAYDKRVLAGWMLLAANKPANTRHCFDGYRMMQPDSSAGGAIR